jgi:hypothetical protein
MALGAGVPAEDEFALCVMTGLSPYMGWCFPGDGAWYDRYLTFRGVPAEEVDRWGAALTTFLKKLTLRHGRPLVLKSPPHTARIRLLLELFPDARFVHIVRDPYVVYPSSIHLLKSLSRVHSLQRPTFEGLDERVLSTYVDLYRKVDEGRELVEPSRFYELRYEDLIADPEGQLRRLYEHLGLGEFDRYLPKLRQYLADHVDYRTNRYELTPQQRAAVDENWGDVIDRYGYRTAGGVPR